MVKDYRWNNIFIKIYGHMKTKKLLLMEVLRKLVINGSIAVFVRVQVFSSLYFSEIISD